MPHIIYSTNALADLKRLRSFLEGKNPHAARAASEAITEALNLLTRFPEAGRPVLSDPPGYRDLFIEFGNSGYIARYRFDGRAVFILAVKHRREAGF
jgi:plasmid stabilization system protein ParE